MSKKNKKAELTKNEQQIQGAIPTLLAVDAAINSEVIQASNLLKAKRKTQQEKVQDDQEQQLQATSDGSEVAEETLVADLIQLEDSDVSLTQTKDNCKINSKGVEECDEGGAWWKALLGLGLLGAAIGGSGGGSSSPVVCVDLEVYSEDGDEVSTYLVNETLLTTSVSHIDDIFVVATGDDDVASLLSDDSDVVIELCSHETNLLTVNAEGDDSRAEFAGDYEGLLSMSGSLEEVVVSATGSESFAGAYFSLDGGIGSIDMIVGADDTLTYDAEVDAVIEVSGDMSGNLRLETTNFALGNYSDDVNIADLTLSLDVEGDLSGNIDLLAFGEDTSLFADIEVGDDLAENQLTGDLTANAVAEDTHVEFNLNVQGDMVGSLVVEAAGDFSYAGNSFTTSNYQALSQGFEHQIHTLEDNDGVLVSGSVTDSDLSDEVGVIDLSATGNYSEAFLNVEIAEALIGDVNVHGSGIDADLDLDLSAGGPLTGDILLDAEGSSVSIDAHVNLGESDVEEGNGVSLSGNLTVNSGVGVDTTNTDVTLGLSMAGDMVGVITMTAGPSESVDLDYNNNSIYIEEIYSEGDMRGNITLLAAGRGSNITSSSQWNWAQNGNWDGEFSQDTAIEFNGFEGNVTFEAAGEDSNVSVDLQASDLDFDGELHLIASGDRAVVHSNLRVDDDYIGLINVQANGEASTAGTRRGLTAATDDANAVYQDYTFIENDFNPIDNFEFAKNHIRDGIADAADSMGYISTEFQQSIDYVAGVNNGLDVFGEGSEYGFFQNQGFIALVVDGNQSDTFEVVGNLGSDSDSEYMVSSLGNYNGFSAFVYKTWEDDGSSHDPEIHRLFIYETSSGATLEEVETDSGDGDEYFRFEGLSNSSKISYIQMFGVPQDGNPSLMSDELLETFFRKYVDDVMTAESLSESLAVLGEDASYQNITNGLELYDPSLYNGEDFEDVVSTSLQVPTAIVVNADAVDSDAYIDIRIDDDLVGHVNVSSIANTPLNAQADNSFAGINLEVGDTWIGDFIAQANGSSACADVDVFVGSESNLFNDYSRDAHVGNIVIESGTVADSWPTENDEDAENNNVNVNIQIAGLNEGNVSLTAGSYYDQGADSIYIEDLNFGVLDGNLNLTAAGTNSEITADNLIAISSDDVWHPAIQTFDMEGNLNFTASGNGSSVSVDFSAGYIYDDQANSQYYPVGGRFTGNINLTASGSASNVESSMDVANEIIGDVSLTASGTSAYVWSDMHVGYVNPYNNFDDEGDVTGNVSLLASGSDSQVDHYVEISGNLNGDFTASATGIAVSNYGEDYYVNSYYGYREYGSAVISLVDVGDIGNGNSNYFDSDGDIGDVYLNADATGLPGLHLGNLVDVEINADRMGDLYINSENLSGGSLVNVDIDLSLTTMDGYDTSETYESVAGDVYVQGGRLNDVYLRYQDAFSSNVYLTYQDENNSVAKFYGSAVIELAGGDLDLYGANEWWNALNDGSGEMDELNNRFMTIYGFTNGDSFANEMDYIWFSSIRDEYVSFNDDEWDGYNNPYVNGVDYWDVEDLNYADSPFTSLADFLIAADDDLDGGLQNDYNQDNGNDTLPSGWQDYAKFYFGVVTDPDDGIADGYLAVDDNGLGISYLIKFDNFTDFNEQQLINTYTVIN